MMDTINQHWIVGLVQSSKEEERPQQRPHGSLWREYFRDPSERWDNRNVKAALAYPDFKHKITKKSLWIDGWYTPSSVEEELIRRGPVLPNHVQIGGLCMAKEKAEKELLCYDEDAAFVARLRNCAKSKDLQQGIILHDEILKRGLLGKCSDALVAMYAQCGGLVIAQQLLDTHRSRNVFSWTALIQGYARQGQGQDALKCFEQMKGEGVSPNAVTYSCILKACGSMKAVGKGEQIHDEIVRQGLLKQDVVLGTSLVDMYVKCGAMLKAQKVFDSLPSRDVVSWSALIAGYAQQGKGEQALDCFQCMCSEGLSPNAVTFACVLKACGSIRAVDKGEEIHDVIARQGLLQSNLVLGNALIDMYAKCGALVKAQEVLEALPSRDAISWSALTAGYAQQGQGEQALKCFERMQHEGLSPDVVTFACILKACGSIGAICKGEELHDHIRREGLLLQGDTFLGTALVNMYAKCGACDKAQQMLEKLPHRNVISWNALVTGYAQQGQTQRAVSCFKRMHQDGLFPDRATFSCLLNACSHSGLVEDGHSHFVTMTTKYGVKPDIEHYTCMIDNLGRAGHLHQALGVIQEMPSSVSTLWSALLGACRKWGDVHTGRWAFEQAVEVNRSDRRAYLLTASIFVATVMAEDADLVEQ